jgi:dihydrofolate reductase
MRLVVQEFMSIDGVVQSPQYPDEDSSGGFTRGGWNMPFMDEDAMRWTVEGIQSADAFLFGRGTFEAFAKHWQNAPPEQAPPEIAGPLASRPKLVASTTLRGPLSWSNSRLLEGDAVESVREEKGHGSGTLLCVGSPGLASSLLAGDLVDELRLMIDPVLIGSGKRAFPQKDTVQRFDVSALRTTGAGAILASFVRRSEPSH